MESVIESGKYVVAVSGGVDSMVLLDLLARDPGLELVVAHFDHGIRPDSAEDRRLVEAAAGRYGFLFVTKEGRLGSGASEASAREARYAFLRDVQRTTGAKAIITAHHEDDRLETAILNLLRGTGRKGLASLRSTPDTIRPLLSVRKDDIRRYAVEHGIVWREDSTNAEDTYARNYVRHHILPRLEGVDRRLLLERIEAAEAANPAIDAMIMEWLGEETGRDAITRRRFVLLPHAIACEVMAAWLRQHSVRDFDRRTVERLVVAAKVNFPGKQADVGAAHMLVADAGSLRLAARQSGSSVRKP